MQNISAVRTKLVTLSIPIKHKIRRANIGYPLGFVDNGYAMIDRCE